MLIGFSTNYSTAGGGGGTPNGTNLTCGNIDAFSLGTNGFTGVNPTTAAGSCGQCCYSGSDLDGDGDQDVSYSVENTVWYEYCNTSGATVNIDVIVAEVNGNCNVQGAIFVGPSGGTDVIDCSNSEFAEYGSNPGGNGNGFSFNVDVPDGECAFIMIDGYGGATCSDLTIEIPCPINCTPPTVMTATAPAICEGESSAIDATVSGGIVFGSTVYSWSPTTALSCTTCEDPTASPTSTTTYTLTACNDGVGSSCCATVDVLVDVTPLFVPDAGPDITACQGSSITIGGSPTGPNGSTYSWAETGNNTGMAISGSSTVANPTIDIDAGASGSGTYTVTVTNGACIFTDEVIITVGVLSVDAGADVFLCEGTTGSIGGAPTAPAGATYSWSETVANGDITISGPSNVANPTVGVNLGGTGSATYEVTATLSGCVNTDIVVVTIDPLPATPTAVASPASICPGISSTLTASGGDGSGTYTWLDGPGGASIGTTDALVVSPSVTTTYYLTSTDAVTGCVSLEGSVTVIVTPAPVANAGTDVTICEADFSLTGSILNPAACGTQSWNIISGTGTWSDNTVLNPTFTPTAGPGDYEFELVPCGSGACTPVSDNVIITITPAPTVVASAQDAELCLGLLTILNAEASGGTPTPPTIVTESFSSGLIEQAIPNNDCSTGSSISIPVGGVIDPLVGTTTVTICVDVDLNNTDDIQIIVCAPGGSPCLTLVPAPNNGLSGNNFISTCFSFDGAAMTGGAPYTGDWVPLGGGSMSDLDGAQTNGTWTMTVFDCTGGPSGEFDSWDITFDTPVANDAYSYSWSPSGDLDDGTIQSPTFFSSGLTAPSNECLDVTVTDDIGCTATDQVCIGIIDVPAAFSLTNDQICADPYTLTGPALNLGETGIWTVISGSGAFDDATDPGTDVSGLTLGDNIFEWTITNSCGSTSSQITITLVAPPTTPTLSNNGPICINEDAIFTINGDNNDDVTYNINGGASTIVTLTGGNATVTVSGATTTQTLTLESVDDGNCIAVLTGTSVVNINPLPTITGTLIACVNGSADLTGSGTPGIIPAWSITGGTGTATLTNEGTNTVTVNGTGAGTIILEYTDVNGCVATETVTFNPLPTITGTLIACVNGSLDLSGSGTPSAGTAWVITGGTGTATLTNAGTNVVTVNGTVAGTIILEYTDVNGCVATETVTFNPLPTITGTLITCTNGTLDLTGSGTPAATPAWAITGGTGTATLTNAGNNIVTVNGTVAGTIILEYTDVSGCIATETVTFNPLPTITGTLSTCVNGTLDLTGSGTPAAAPAWSITGGTGTATLTNAGNNIVTVNGTVAGTIILEYTDLSGCVAIETVTFNPTPTITGTLSACVNGTLDLTASGTPAAGTAWIITGGTGTGTLSNEGTNVVTVTGTAAGTVILEYTDINGCLISETVTFNVLPTIGGTLNVCVGLSTQLTGSGTPDGTAPWMSSNPGVASVNSTGLVNAVSAGPTDITYTDINGCTVTETVTVEALPTYTLTPTDPNTCNAVNGSILIEGLVPGSSYDVTYDSGTPLVLSAEVANGSGEITIPALGAGTYTVTIASNSTTCVGLPIVTSLINPGAPTINPYGLPTVCDSYIVPAITGTTLSGNQEYYDATGGPGGGGTIVNEGDVITTSTILYAYDENGSCSNEEILNITVNITPDVALLANQIECDSYELIAIGGTNLTGNEAYYDLPGGPLGGGTQISVGGTITAPGTTTLYMYDETNTSPNCFDEETFTVTINLSPDVTPLANQVACDTYTLPVITGTNLTGTQAYYDAVNGGGTQYNSGDAITAAGATTLYIYDETGTLPNCFDEETFTVTINLTPVLDPLANQVACDTYTLPVITGANLTGTEAYYDAVNGGGTQYTAGDFITALGVTTLYIYDETGTATNCSDEETFTVTIIETPVYTLTPADPTVCNGTDGSILIDGLGIGVTYDVTYDDGTPTNLPGELANGSGQITVSGLAAGTYTITITPTGTTCIGLPVNATLINPGAPIIDPYAVVVECDTYAIPPITGSLLTGSAAYYDLAGGPTGGGALFSVGTPITSSTILYAFDENGACASEEILDITINPTPALAPLANQVACDTYTLPVITGTNLTGTEAYYDAVNGGGTQYSSGDAITASGANTFYIFDETGTLPNCFDEETFTVTINLTPVVDPLANQVACDTYTLPVITGANLTGTEAYYDAVNGGGTQYTAGDFITALGVTTLYIYDETGTATNCSDEETFTVTINETPDITPLANQVECDTYTLPFINGNLTGNEAYYDTPNGLGTQYNPGDLIAALGVTTLYIYGETGTIPNCFDEETFTVTINETPVYTLTPTDPTLCNATDGSILIEGLLAGGVYDVVIDDGTPVNMPGEVANGSGQITLGTLGYGTYTITITPTESTCVGLPVGTVLNNPGAPTLDLIADTTVCDLFNLEVIIGTGLTGFETYWSGAGATGTQYNVGDAITSTTTMYAYDINGVCWVEEPFVITVNLTPVLDAIADVLECETYTLPAIMGTSLSGNENFYNDSQLNGGTVLTGPITATQTVWVYDENGLCSDELSFDVTINPLPTVTNVIGEGTYCPSEIAADILVDVTGTADWSVDYTLDGTVQNATGSSSPINLGNAAGVYVVTNVTDLYCTNMATGTQTVTINPLPSAPLAGTDSEYCSTVPFADMTASGGVGTMTWYSDAALTSVISTGPTLTPNNTEGTTTYYVTETLNGCEGPESEVIITVNFCTITVPTAFTPDGDGVNDDWEILDIDQTYPNNMVYVYNRWGNLLFTSVQGDYDNNRWDGTYNGDDLPVGSYYFIIEYNDEVTEPSNGVVSIILNK